MGNTCIKSEDEKQISKPSTGVAPPPPTLPVPEVEPEPEDKIVEQIRTNFDHDGAAKWQPSFPNTEEDSKSSSKPIRIDEFKRVYHNIEDSPYALPADITEGKRLNLQHEIFKNVSQKLYFVDELKADLENGIKVLDVGTGSGIWAAEMATFFPKSQFYTVDLALGDWVELAAKLPNVTCQFGNVLEKLPFEDNTFDFVHQRALVAGIPHEKWPGVVQELKRVTKKGGWLELVEGDGYAHKGGYKFQAFYQAMDHVLGLRGIKFATVCNISEMMKEASFQNIRNSYFSIPFGWDGLIGDALSKDYFGGLNSMKGILASFLKVDGDLYEKMLKEAIDEVSSLEKAYVNVYWSIGQKPT